MVLVEQVVLVETMVVVQMEMMVVVQVEMMVVDDVVVATVVEVSEVMVVLVVLVVELVEMMVEVEEAVWMKCSCLRMARHHPGPSTSSTGTVTKER